MKNWKSLAHLSFAVKLTINHSPKIIFSKFDTDIYDVLSDIPLFVRAFFYSSSHRNTIPIQTKQNLLRYEARSKEGLTPPTCTLLKTIIEVPDTLHYKEIVLTFIWIAWNLFKETSAANAALNNNSD